MSVHREGAWSWGVPGRGVSALGVPGPGRCLVPGGVCSGGVPGPGGLVSQHALRQTPGGQATTAADGTHPTGMHSSILLFSSVHFRKESVDLAVDCIPSPNISKSIPGSQVSQGKVFCCNIETVSSPQARLYKRFYSLKVRAAGDRVNSSGSSGRVRGGRET